MRIFWATVLIILCVAFSLMSACFGFFGVFLSRGSGGNVLTGLLWFAICAVLGGLAFFCGRAARGLLRRTV
jgi:hypothetical protein